MKYVEYDESGALFHVCEALISDPPSSPVFLMSDEQKKEHEKRVAEHQSFGRSLQLASLIDSHQKIQAATPGRGIHILDDDAELPTLGDPGGEPASHKYDHAKGKIRPLTAAEKKAHVADRDARLAAADAENEAREQARVDKAVAAALAKKGIK